MNTISFYGDLLTTAEVSCDFESVGSKLGTIDLCMTQFEGTYKVAPVSILTTRSAARYAFPLAAWWSPLHLADALITE